MEPFRCDTASSVIITFYPLWNERKKIYMRERNRTVVSKRALTLHWTLLDRCSLPHLLRQSKRLLYYTGEAVRYCKHGKNTRRPRNSICFRRMSLSQIIGLCGGLKRKTRVAAGKTVAVSQWTGRWVIITTNSEIINSAPEPPQRSWPPGLPLHDLGSQ